MSEPEIEMVKYFTDNGEILVPVGSSLMSPVVGWQDEKAPVWVSVAVLALSAVIALGSFGILVWSVTRLF